jgi:ubiquinone/menaquinone biosynthesis C-methylase UbiE
MDFAYGAESKFSEERANCNNLEKLLLTASNNPLLRSVVNRLALAYIHWEPIKLIEAREIFSMLHVKSRDRILDVACGYGQTSIDMRKMGGCVCGYDIDNKSIAIAKILAGGRDDIDFEVGNAEALPFEPDSFDKVVCVCALEHFQDDEKALEQMYRVLRPGGALVLSVDSFTYKGIRKEFQERHRLRWFVVNYYSRAQLAEKLQKAGFIVEQSKYLISSPLSACIFKLHNTSESRLCSLLLKLTLPLCYVLATGSDRWFSRTDEGYLLAVKAKKPA